MNAFERGFIKSAEKHGLNAKEAHSLLKVARPLEGKIVNGPGPDMMEYALNQYLQAKALVRPTEEQLDSRDLSRDAFQKHMRNIATSTQDGQRFNLSDNAPSPYARGIGGALIGLLAGGGAGFAGNADVGDIATNAIGGAGLGGLIGAGTGAVAKKNYTNTAKMLKDYGMLNPQTLRKAYPLLSDDLRYK